MSPRRLASSAPGAGAPDRHLVVRVMGRRPRQLRFRVDRVVNGGYAGRNRDAVLHHIEELRRVGVPAPDSIPAFYPVPGHTVLQGPVIEVGDARTSGEAEYVLLVHQDGILVTVGSDHTDRDLEQASVLKSKQICPNVLAMEAWPLEDVEARWDSLVLRSWIRKAGRQVLYQRAPLSVLLPPKDLLAEVRRHVRGNLIGLVLFSGTIPTIAGELICGSPFFQVELWDPKTDRRLTCAYRVRPMDWNPEGNADPPPP